METTTIPLYSDDISTSLLLFIWSFNTPYKKMMFAGASQKMYWIFSIKRVVTKVGSLRPSTFNEPSYCQLSESNSVPFGDVVENFNAF